MRSRGPRVARRGRRRHPLYEFLTSEETNPKFGGVIVAQFGIRTAPDDKELVEAVEQAQGVERRLPFARPSSRASVARCCFSSAMIRSSHSRSGAGTTSRMPT